MNDNTVKGLELLNGLLILFVNGLEAVAKMNKLIGDAQNEGRDLTDQELADLQADTDSLHNSTLDRLREIAES